ncbi:SDR family NAD(P)-dependent oxidoreductase [Bryobacter aggregatus]|uniref:SDR family NAD(P)-dependent oxidoreductase n=1 Tax=Bryobacter aggregatus TaxID=360054 RepID=UPI0004E2202F|nr:SDR family oxidoreductase [Bryobacter aggregatus]
MSAETTAKAAIVTGASKGIGKCIAIELARAGFDVAVNYNTDLAGAQDTVFQIEELGRKAVAIQANVGDTESARGLFTAFDKHFKDLHVVVANAAVQTWSPLLDLQIEDWDRVLNTNLRGTFICTQEGARRMVDKGHGGSIVTIGSGCNKLAFPRLVDYTASKGGIEMFTKVAAVELGKYQIRVNCVAPGATEVERTKHETGDYAGTWAPITPLGRIGMPLDIARAVLFFAGDQSEFVTGQTLTVDGGVTAKPQWPYEF